MKTTITASQEWILHGVRATKLDKIPLKASIFAISLAVFASGVAPANDKLQESGPAVGKASSYAAQMPDCSVSQSSSTLGQTGVLHPVETNPAIAYVPSYRTGLRWKN